MGLGEGFPEIRAIALTGRPGSPGFLTFFKETDHEHTQIFGNH